MAEPILIWLDPHLRATLKSFDIPILKFFNLRLSFKFFNFIKYSNDGVSDGGMHIRPKTFNFKSFTQYLKKSSAFVISIPPFCFSVPMLIWIK